jgi:hypothetical protein
MDDEPISKVTAGEAVHRVLRAVISAVPTYGGPGVELFNTLIASPLEARRNRWMEETAIRLALAEHKLRRPVKELLADESFTSVLIQASVVAMKNHQAEKLAALRAAVVNAATGNGPSDDEQLMFLRFVDELSARHLSVLAMVSRYEEEIGKLISYDEVFKFFVSKDPSISDREVLLYILAELRDRRLIHFQTNEVVDADDGYFGVVDPGDPKNTRRILAMDWGRRFLAFVTDTQVNE